MVVKSLKIWFVIMLLSVTAYAQNWELAKNEDGISVYTKSVEGAKVKSFKVIVTFDCENLDIPYNIMKDYAKIPDWVSDVESVKLVERLDKYTTVEYHKVAVPWPFSSRDIVLMSKFKFDEKKSFTKHISPKLNLIDEKEEYVRIKELKGSWYFEKINDKEIKLTYQMLADPAGNLPAWVINLFLVDGPFDTVTNFLKMVEKAQ